MCMPLSHTHQIITMRNLIGVPQDADKKFQISILMDIIMKQQDSTKPTS